MGIYEVYGIYGNLNHIELFPNQSQTSMQRNVDQRDGTQDTEFAISRAPHRGEVKPCDIVSPPIFGL